MQRKNFFRASIVAASLMLAIPVLAQTTTSAPDDGPAVSGREFRGERHRQRGEGRRAMPEEVRLHMELGRYYLLDESYETARDHFLAAARYEPTAEEAAALEADDDARPGRGERRGRAGVRGRMHAYLLAAVSSVLAGDVDGGVALAEEAQALRPEPPAGAPRRGARDETRPHRQLDDFLADPEGFAADFAGGVAALEERLLEVEAGVDENADE